MSLLDPRPRVATAVTETPARLYVLEPREWSLPIDLPSVARKLLAVLARRLRAAESGPTR